MNISARKILCGTVTRVIDGPFYCEVNLVIGGGEVKLAVITQGSSEKLGFTEGCHACAIFKAPSVIIGMESANHFL